MLAALHRHDEVDDDGEKLAVVEERGRDGRADLAEANGRGELRMHDLGVLLDDGLEDEQDGRVEDLPLVLEVTVEDRARHAAAVGEVLEGDVVIALPREQADGVRDDDVLARTMVDSSFHAPSIP